MPVILCRTGTTLLHTAAVGTTGHFSTFTVLLLKGADGVLSTPACFSDRKFGPFMRRLTEFRAKKEKKYLIVSPQFRLSKGLLQLLAKPRLKETVKDNIFENKITSSSTSIMGIMPSYKHWLINIPSTTRK